MSTHLLDEPAFAEMARAMGRPRWRVSGVHVNGYRAWDALTPEERSSVRAFCGHRVADEYLEVAFWREGRGDER